MVKKYESPELEIIKITLTENLLTISEGENSGSGGFIEEPDGDMVEP